MIVQKMPSRCDGCPCSSNCAPSRGLGGVCTCTLGCGDRSCANNPRLGALMIPGTSIEITPERVLIAVALAYLAYRLLRSQHDDRRRRRSSRRALEQL